MRKRSWKTTTCGIISIVGSCLMAAFESSTYPIVFKVGFFLASLGSSAGLFFARDNDVSSSELRFREPSHATVDRKNGSWPVVGLLLLCSLLFLGCKNPQRAAFNVLSTTAFTVDRAMLGWSNRVATASVPLSSRYTVRDVYTSYERSMQTAIDALDTWTLVSAYGAPGEAERKQTFELLRSTVFSTSSNLLFTIQHLSR